MDNSKVLTGYMTFVDKARVYEGELKDLDAAIKRAIDECIEEDKSASLPQIIGSEAIFNEEVEAHKEVEVHKNKHDKQIKMCYHLVVYLI